MGGLLNQFASYIMTVDMFPVFFAAHFGLACVMVREDSQDLGRNFHRKHPFATWFCTVFTGLSGAFAANFLFGEPLIDIMKENTLIIFATLVWYQMTYFPCDFLYKIFTLPPVLIGASVLQECLRLRFLYLGLHQAAKIYPQAYIIILLGGIIQGNGYGFIKIVERLVRGKWTPTSNEILEVTYFAKSSLYASILFLLHHIKILEVPIQLFYFGILIVFVVCRMLIMLAKVEDPLLLIEAPVYAFLFGNSDDDDDEKKLEKKKEEKVDKETTKKQKIEKKTN